MWTERCNIVESFLFKLIYRFNAISVKIPADFLVAISKLILKFIWRGIRPRILKEGNTVTGMTLLDFKTYYKTKVLKIDDIGGKNKQIYHCKEQKA